MWCRMGGVGARSRKRAGLGYRLVRKYARTVILDLFISMFLGLGYVSMRLSQKICIHILHLPLGHMLMYPNPRNIDISRPKISVRACFLTNL